MSLTIRALLAVVTAGAVLAGCQGADSGFSSLERPEEVSSGPAGSPPPGELAAQDVWTIRDPRIDESSGLAWGQEHPDVLYTHNDRGSTPVLYAVDDHGTLAALQLDALALDWEDIATTPDGRIWVGDIGDNDQARSVIEVVVVDEPEVLVSADVPSTTYTLAYPDGPDDAEALLVDPRDGRVYVVTKDPAGGRVYRAPEQLVTDGVNELVLVGLAPAGVTGGDIAPDGGAVVLRTQARAFFYPELGGPSTVVALPGQSQGESVTFTPDGTHVLVGSEGVNSRVQRVPVPTLGE